MMPPASTLAAVSRVRGRDKWLAQAAAALEPLKAELLRRASAEAAERLRRAAAEDAATVSRAEEEAAAILEQAREQGRAEAAVFVAAQRARSRRQARAVILRTRREFSDELRRRATAAVARLSTEPGYPELHNRLVSYVRAQLGDEAALSDAAGGGVIGVVPGRRLDCSFATLVEQILVEQALVAQAARSDVPWTT